MVWAGIMQDTRTPLHGSVNAQRYRQEILQPYVRLFRGAAGPEFVFMDDNARPHRVSWLRSIWKAKIFIEWIGQPNILTSTLSNMLGMLLGELL